MTFESIWEIEVGLLVSKFSVFIFLLLEGMSEMVQLSPSIIT